MEHLRLCHQALPQRVQPVQLLFLHLIRLAGEKAAVPPVTPKPCFNRIIFQNVRLLRFHVRQSAPQVMKYGVIGKILQIQLQRTLDILHHRVQENTPRPVDKARNIHLGKLRLDIGRIPFQIARDNRNIPVSKPFLPRQPSDEKSGLMYLVPRCRRLENADVPLLLPIAVNMIAEQIPLEMLQRRCLFLSGSTRHSPVRHEGVLSPAHSGIRRKPRKVSDRLLT